MLWSQNFKQLLILYLFPPKYIINIIITLKLYPDASYLLISSNIFKLRETLKAVKKIVFYLLLNNFWATKL
jgi:hypothetical protein